MHHNELNIDEKLAANLIKQQYPEFADFHITKVKHYGTDNAIFRIGSNYAIRLPRIKYAAEQIKKEIKWLPKFASHFSLTIPSPIKIGKPSQEFPYPWYVYNWIKGVDVYNCIKDAYNTLI